MKAKEFIIEVKSSEPPKPRNFVAKNAQKTTSGAGAHKDKKRAEKQGDVKHKKQAIPMEGAAGTKPGWMLKQDPKLAAKVKAKTDLAKKRQASYGDPSAGKSADKQGVAEGILDVFKDKPLPTKPETVKLGGFSVEIEPNNSHIGFAWRDSSGREHYEEVSTVGNEFSANTRKELISKIKDEIKYQEQQLKKQGVAEVSKDTLDRYVAKASDAHGFADFNARMSKDDPTLRSYHKDQKKAAEKRRQGVSRALDRMSRNEGSKK